MSQPFTFLRTPPTYRFTIRSQAVGVSSSDTSSLLLPFFNRNCGYAFERLPDWPILPGFEGFGLAHGQQQSSLELQIRWE
jgi:hypothetical protein